MSDTTMQPGLSVALLGNPNCGKTALFNLLTGSRQKVANYAGVTVERKEGTFSTPAGRQVRVLDLPGAYSLNAVSADEAVTRDVVRGSRADEGRPDLLVCVTDATNLKLNLRMVVEVRRLGVPMVLALNMSDVAKKRGIAIDIAALERELGMPVVETVAVRRDGARHLIERIEASGRLGAGLPQPDATPWHAASIDDVLAAQAEVRRILAIAVREPTVDARVDDAIDAVVLHPVWGMLVLGVTLF
ncbi:MAG: FeoB small GTPase domain-containing protein, partial [Burkholderiaceae bacterium]